jgi:hypothetical protein
MFPSFAQFTGKWLTAPNAGGAGTKYLFVSVRHITPSEHLRERPYLQDLSRFDPPPDDDLHTKRVIGFHDDPNRGRGGNLDVIIVVVAEPYDLIVGNAEINAMIESLAASPQLTQPLMRHDEIWQHRHRKYPAKPPPRLYARATDSRDILFRREMNQKRHGKKLCLNSISRRKSRNARRYFAGFSFTY